MKTKVEKAAEAKKVKATLSAEEVRKLAECEEAIQESSKMFFMAGEALFVISKERLYKAEFSEFDAYCEGRWGFSGSHARRLMDAYKLVEKLQSGIPDLGDDKLPQNEFQARLYMDLREEKHWVRSWKTMLKAAKERSVPISAALIQEVCGKAEVEDGCKKPNPKAKAKFAGTDKPQLQYVEVAIGLVSTARVKAKDYCLKDWIRFLDDLAKTLKSV